MKALFYTLILSSILIIGIIFLYHLETSPRGDKSVFLQAPTRTDLSIRPSSLSGEDLEGYSTSELYASGLQLMESWHPIEAREIFRKVTNRDSLRMEAYVQLALCAADPSAGSEEEVDEYLKQASGLSGGNGFYVSGLRELLIRKDYARAIEEFKKALGSTPRDLNAMYYLARAYFEEGKIKEAEKQIETILSEDESHGWARKLLVDCMIAEGDFDRAQRLARDLAGLYPREPYPYVLLTFVEAIRGDYPTARDFCNNALKLDPRYIPAILAEGYLYSLEAKPEASHVSFEKMLLFDNPWLEATARDAMAYLDFLSGRFDEAIEEMDELIRVLVSSGANRRAYYYIFRTIDYLCELGQREVAGEILRKWSPQLEEIPLQIAKLRLEISSTNLENAKHVLQEIEDKADWRAWMRLLDADYREVMALTLIKGDDFEEAVNLLTGGGKSNVSGTKADYLLGFAAFENGDAEKAAEYFYSAVSRRFNTWFPYHEDPILSVQALFYLGECSMARGDIEEAKKYYSKFLSHWAEANWELQAVVRSRERLENLPPQKKDG